MRVRGGTAALVAACAGVCVPASAAAPPQGVQANATFAASYAQRGVTSVAATTQRVSCYAPQVYYTGRLEPAQGYPDGGSTLCNGAATTGENIGPFSIQDVSNPPLRAKDFSESDLHIDPTNAQHLIGISKWVVNSEGYNHLTGFFESFDGGATWPQLGHIPGYEGWTDNSDPVGAFDPWGNFYAVVFPYQFSYIPSGQHFFLSPDVNPSLPRSGLGIAVRPHAAATATAWNTTHGGQLDLIERTPFNGKETFDKQWLAIDTNRRSRHFGRVYVTWAIGNQDRDLRIYGSYADARANGTHTNWSRPRLVLAQTLGTGDNGSLPRVAPDGTVWLTTTSFRNNNEPFTMSLTSSRDGGRSWARRTGDRPPQRRRVSEHDVPGRLRRGIRGRAAEDRPLLPAVRRVRAVRCQHDEAVHPRFVRRREALVSGDPGERRARRERRAAAEPCRRAQRDRGSRVLRPAACVSRTRHAGGNHRGPGLRPARGLRARELLRQHRDPVLRPEAACRSATTSVCRSTRGIPNCRRRASTASAIRRASSATTSASTRAEVSPTRRRSRRSTPRGENPGYHQQQLVSKIRTP